MNQGSKFLLGLIRQCIGMTYMLRACGRLTFPEGKRSAKMQPYAENLLLDAVVQIAGDSSSLGYARILTGKILALGDRRSQLSRHPVEVIFQLADLVVAPNGKPLGVIASSKRARSCH